MRLYIPLPPGTRPVRVAGRVRPGEQRERCATLPAYDDRWTCARAHPGCVPWPVEVGEPMEEQHDPGATPRGDT